MTKKTKIDLITSLILIICGSVIMLMPLLNINNVKIAFIVVMTIYAISNLINYLLVRKSQDGEGLYTTITSLISIVLLFVLNVSTKPINLAIVVLIWALGMSLVKLKKADYYHDKKDSLWIVLVITLFIFILISLLTTINLYYSSEIQVLMLGNFFFINGILDLIDPLANYIKEKN